MEIYFLMLLFAMVPLTYAGCPDGMCCPVGDNCEVSNRFCKPDSSRDCRGVQIRFSSRTYKRNEGKSSAKVCIKLKLSRPAPMKFRVTVSDVSYTATGDMDYKSGPYRATIKKRKTTARFCIKIIDDDNWEMDEVFGLEINDASLPSGVVRASPYRANVTLMDNEVLVSFSEDNYTVYEHRGPVCPTLVLDKPAPFDFTVQTSTEASTANGDYDFDSGLQSVMFTKGDIAATFCVNITDDESLEIDETFSLAIDNASLPAGVIYGNPYTADVTILDNEYTFCFDDQLVHTVIEDEGPLSMSLTLSRALPFDISVQFLYRDISACGNDSVKENFDYYTSMSFPNFDIIPAYTTHYTLKIDIVADHIIEDNELFQVTVVPQHRFLGQPDCHFDVIIRDDDDIKLEFESRSYTVDNKNNPETPVIRITYPVIVPPHLFPIHIKVEAEDDTASEGVDYRSLNYTYIITNQVERLQLTLSPLDDNIAEADETYNLTIVILSFHDRVILGENKTTTITICNDDVAFLDFDGSFLLLTRKLELPSNAIVSITYADGQRNMITITPEEAIQQSTFPLPNFGVNVTRIDVHFPHKFNSVKGPNVQSLEDIILAHYDL